MAFEFDLFSEKIHSIQRIAEKYPFIFDSLSMINEFKVVICGDCGVGKSSLLERLLGRRLDHSSICKPKIYSIATIIDFIHLPGLTEISKPDQAPDYPSKTADWFDFHVNEADLILLCVAVDADLVNSNGLKRIKNLNADRKTVLVLSKLDLLERKEFSEDYLNVLQQVAMDFDSIVALRNEQKGPMDKIDENEAFFFEKDFKLNCTSEIVIKLGIKEVKERILNVLSDKLAVIENEVKFQMMKTKLKMEERLKSIKSVNGSSTGSFLQLITDYIDEVSMELEGNGKNDISTASFDKEFWWSDLTPGMRINLILWNNFPETVKSIKPVAGIENDQLGILIKNSQVTNIISLSN